MASDSVGDRRFFAHAGPHALAAVVAAAGGAMDDVQWPAGQGREASQVTVVGIAPLEVAGPGQVSFLDNRRYAATLRGSAAGAVILRRDMLEHLPADCIGIVTPDPYMGWARVAALFHPPAPVVPGVHATALLDPTATVDPSAEIGPLVVIAAGASVGPRCRIAAGAVIGPSVELGADCRIGAHVSISHAILGQRVCLYPGVRVGQDGFGFAAGPAGFVSVPQLGRVIIEDDVEVGANSCIDRGSAQDTVIGAGSRLDNLVQIGHNVRLGRCCVIVAQAGISGSTVLEDFVVMAGQSGVAGHVRIGARTRIGAQAGVISDVAAGAELIGSPAQPARQMFRQWAVLKRLAARNPPRPGSPVDGKTGEGNGQGTGLG